MLAVTGQNSVDVPTPKDRRRAHGACAPAVGADQLTLAKGDVLFHEGECRLQPYRVERGAICHYMNWQDGRHDVIEFAFPGDIIGFGKLAEHVSTAQALVDTAVVPVSPLDFEQELAQDAQLAARLAAAADREFDYIREKAVAHGSAADAMQRLASYLLAISGREANQNRTGLIVREPLATAFVADRLKMPLSELDQLIRDLEQQGLVERTDGGLAIRDAARLEQTADGA